jgi:hypothetical protein
MPYTVTLRTEVFVVAAKVAGYRSYFALAKAMGVQRSTVKRVLDGSLHPGPAFIAGALTALPPATFEQLFRITAHHRRTSRDVGRRTGDQNTLRGGRSGVAHRAEQPCRAEPTRP